MNLCTSRELDVATDHCTLNYAMLAPIIAWHIWITPDPAVTHDVTDVRCQGQLLVARQHLMNNAMGASSPGFPSPGWDVTCPRMRNPGGHGMASVKL